MYDLNTRLILSYYLLSVHWRSSVMVSSSLVMNKHPDVDGDARSSTLTIRLKHSCPRIKFDIL